MFVRCEGPHGLICTWRGCCSLCLRHKPTELAHSFLLCSCVYCCLHGPFNCISFHEFSRQLSAISLCSPCLISALLVFSTIYLFMPRSGELRTPKLKSHLVKTQSFNFLPLKPAVGQYIATIHAMLTARDSFLAYFYPSCPFTCIFFKTSPDFSFVGCG